ncbi:MAG TPA: hypothetical protein VL098_12655 [Flavipsychrobacter sp.]|nr:hypothetical protein [Flavipsychrobacter sp.]
MAAKKENGLKFILIFGTILLFGGIIAINWDAIKKFVKGTAGTDNSDDGSGTNTTGTGSGTVKTGNTGVSVLDWNKVLKSGVKGSEVLTLQQAMNKYNNLLSVKKFSPALVEDGIFGSNTANALQKLTGLSSITLNQTYSMMKSAF